MAATGDQPIQRPHYFVMAVFGGKLWRAKDHRFGRKLDRRGRRARDQRRHSFFDPAGANQHHLLPAQPAIAPALSIANWAADPFLLGCTPAVAVKPAAESWTIEKLIEDEEAAK